MSKSPSTSLPPSSPPSAPRFLSHAELDSVIRLAPLIAIDLIIRNASGGVLLGLRRNEPAKDCYFVPGGHSELRWWPVAELLSSQRVHANAKAYFRPPAAPGAAAHERITPR